MKRTIQISKPIIQNQEINAVVKVLKSGYLSQGPLVKELEDKIAAYCGVPYVVALNSGTSTLHTALYALGVEEGDEVITTPFTFVATANSILMQRAKVVFADIEDATFNIDPDKLEQHISKKTKAIMPVDLFGHIYDIDKINTLVKKYKIPVLEDAAQSIGAEYKGKRSGAVADIASYSLYATKNLTAGVGGLLTFKSKRYMQKAKLFRHHGQEEGSEYDYVQFGYNYRMMDMIAAIAIEQLKKIEKFTKARRRNAALYNKYLKDVSGMILPVERPGYRHVYHQYTVRITKDFPLSRDRFIEYMAKKGVQCKIYYPKPLHLFPHLKAGYKKGSFPVAEQMAREVVSIPVHPLVTKDDVAYITEQIAKIK